jgi:hypothetical protein
MIHQKSSDGRIAGMESSGKSRPQKHGFLAIVRILYRYVPVPDGTLQERVETIMQQLDCRGLMSFTFVLQKTHDLQNSAALFRQRAHHRFSTQDSSLRSNHEHSQLITLCHHGPWVDCACGDRLPSPLAYFLVLSDFLSTALEFDPKIRFLFWKGCCRLIMPFFDVCELIVKLCNICHYRCRKTSVASRTSKSS